MPPVWMYHEVCKALNITPQGIDFAIENICTDSRAATKGSLFIALQNALDGHNFIPQALANGAVAVLVMHPVEDNIPQLIVPNTFVAMNQLAAAARARFTGKIIGVTGSCGKTTVKNFLKAALPNAYGATKSFNNHVGVPLTLMNMPANASYGVIEMGMNHAGEIAPLTKLARPDVAIVTTIQPVHLENLGSLEGIRAEKLSITHGLKPNGTLVLGEGVTVTETEWNGNILHMDTDALDIDFTLSQPTDVRLYNAKLALLAAKAAGANVADVAQNLTQADVETGRGNIHTMAGITIIDESYNANPASIRAALQVLKETPATGKRIALLADMAELGETAPQLHAGLADATDGVDTLICVGNFMKNLADQTNATHYATVADINISALAKSFKIGDIVTIKGSNGQFWAHNFVPNLIKTLKELNT